MSGRLHRRGDVNSNSRSPLMNRILILGLCFAPFYLDVGEIHRVAFCVNSRSPHCVFAPPHFRPIGKDHNIHRAGIWVGYPIPYIVYI